MKLEDQVWELLPNFSDQLTTAMNRAGLSAGQVAHQLQDLGFATTRSQVNRLMTGELDRRTGIRRRPNPTLVLLAGLTKVLDVPASWWFERSPQALADELDRFYSRRIEET